MIDRRLIGKSMEYIDSINALAKKEGDTKDSLKGILDLLYDMHSEIEEALSTLAEATSKIEGLLNINQTIG